MADPKHVDADDADFVDGQSSPPRGDFLNDPEMEGLTLYEKKAHLVNRELDSHGMGRYQWCIFFLCGFGYLIDLLYAQVRFGTIGTNSTSESRESNADVVSRQAFGLVEPAMKQEFGFGGEH